MIFVTVGSQKFPFDRLLKAVDQLPADYDVFAQTGYSSYLPQNYAYQRFLDRDAFAEYIEKADIIITHAGTGAIMSAVKKGKKVIAVPRLKEYGEHVDDHQTQIVEELGKQNILCPCMDMDIEKAIRYAQETEFTKWQSDRDQFIESIDEFIRDC